MLIVAGRLYVHPQERDRWVAAHHEITRIARSQPGCLDLRLSADPLEEGRINLFEQWESEAALRASAHRDSQLPRHGHNGDAAGCGGL